MVMPTDLVPIWTGVMQAENFSPAAYRDLRTRYVPTLFMRRFAGIELGK
jgi:hypothetical protein